MLGVFYKLDEDEYKVLLSYLCHYMCRSASVVSVVVFISLPLRRSILHQMRQYIN